MNTYQFVFLLAIVFALNLGYIFLRAHHNLEANIFKFVVAAIDILLAIIFAIAIFGYLGSLTETL